MRQTTQRLEATIWVLIYGGLIAATLGWFALALDEALGAMLMWAGGGAVLAGALLIWVRSRIQE